MVGEAFIDKLTDAAGFLGPLPPQWRVRYETTTKSQGYYRCKYWNEETGQRTLLDPRLGELDGWDVLDHVPKGQTGHLVALFRNKSTGDIMNSDPRMLGDELEKRGVLLQYFALV